MLRAEKMTFAQELVIFEMKILWNCFCIVRADHSKTHFPSVLWGIYLLPFHTFCCEWNHLIFLKSINTDDLEIPNIRKL